MDTIITISSTVYDKSTGLVSVRASGFITHEPVPPSETPAATDLLISVHWDVFAGGPLPTVAHSYRLHLEPADPQ